MSARQDEERSDTKTRIRDAAVEAFAEKGFRDVTVADICGRAEANIASVNYYFGSKENLYVAAWRSAFQRGIEKYPPEAGLYEGAAPEDRLRSRIASLMRRILDGETREFAIVRHELACPTGKLREAHEKTIGPFRRETFRVVREILGPAATDGHVVQGLFTVISPVLHLVQRVKRGDTREEDRFPAPGLLEVRDPEAMIEHTLRFIMAGLAEMKRGIEAGNWPRMEMPDEFIRKFTDMPVR